MIAVADNRADILEAEQTLIVGLGKTGLSCARFLQSSGESFTVTDDRDNPPGLVELQSKLSSEHIHVGGFCEIDFKNANRLIVSPGIDCRQPLIEEARKNNVEVVGDIELFAQNAKAPIIAITGSNGKSTVTTLISEMANKAGLSTKMGGNIGTPALDLLAAPDFSGAPNFSGDSGVPDFYILELSSFQLETTYTLDAYAAVVLNVSPDHLDRYAGLLEYAAAKQRAYRGNGAMIVNIDDEIVIAMAGTDAAKQCGREVIGFGLGAPKEGAYGVIHKAGEAWLARAEMPLIPVSQLKMAGLHNQANALAAMALGEVMKVPMVAMLETLRSFAGLAHRTQWVADIDGVHWYNDSKGTNIGATIAAIQGMSGQKVLIAGGQGKGADFQPLRQVVLNNNVKAVVLIGCDAVLIEQVLKGAVPVVFASDMSDAVIKAQQIATSGDCVLLSPACASFDMYRNFEERGEAFIAAVKGLDQ